MELGLVLAPLAVLTRRRVFWSGGVGIATLGALVSASAFFVH